MKTKASIIIFLISCCLFTSEVLGQNSSSTIPFKVLKKPYAWDIKSVTYLGRKNAGYRLRIKGVASRDRDNSYGFSGMSVDVGYYMRNGHQQITGTYFFPPVKKGQPFNVEIVAFLPNGYTLSNIGGFLFTSGFDYEEEVLPPKKSAVEFTLPTIVEENSTPAQEPIKLREPQMENDVYYTVVEAMPSFPGGEAEMVKFISENLRYPVVAQEAGIQGRVTLRFVVSKTGTIENITVIRSLDPSCDKEAIRVVKSMPKWTPGKQNGLPVNVYFNLPISFKLNH